MHARIGWQNLRKSEFLDSGDYYLITGTDFVDGEVDLANCHYITKDRYDQDPNIQIENGSILITKDGTLGKVAYVKGLEKPATLNAGVFNVLIRDKKRVYGKYLFQYLKAPFLLNYVTQKATGGTIKHLNQEILVDFPVVLPDYDEQVLLGNAFDDLDNLITLHHRKCGIERETFKYFWEQRKFRDTFSILKNNTLSRAELSQEGFALNIHYGDILIKYGEILDVSAAMLPFIPNADLASKFNSSTLEDGDIIMADTAEDETVGKCSEILNLQGEPAISGLHTIPCRPVIKFAPGYLGYYMNSDAYHDQLFPLMQGIKVTSISKSALQDTVLSWPTSVDEQTKIGQYFMNLDNLITLHHRK